SKRPGRAHLSPCPATAATSGIPGRAQRRLLRPALPPPTGRAPARPRHSEPQVLASPAATPGSSTESRARRLRPEPRPSAARSERKSALSQGREADQATVWAAMAGRRAKAERSMKQDPLAKIAYPVKTCRHAKTRRLAKTAYLLQGPDRPEETLRSAIPAAATPCWHRFPPAGPVTMDNPMG